MATYRTLNTFFLSSIDPSYGTLKKDEISLMRASLEAVSYATYNERADSFLFFPWMVRLANSSHCNDALVAYALKILCNNLQLYQTPHLFGLENIRSTEFLSKLAAIGFKTPVQISNSFAWRLIRLLPSEYQINFIHIPGIEDTLRNFFSNTKSVTSNVEQSKVNLPIKKASQKGGKNDILDVALTAEEFYANIITEVTHEAIKSIGSLLISNWHIVSGKSNIAVFDISMDLLNGCILHFFNAEAVTQSNQIKPFAASVYCLDMLLYHFLSLPTNGLGAAPTCFLDPLYQFNQTYNIAVVKLIPKILVGLQSIITNLQQSLPTNDASLNKFNSMPDGYLCESPFIFHDTTIIRKMSNEEKNIIQYEVWCLRATLLCMMSSGMTEIADKAGQILQITKATLSILSVLESSLMKKQQQESSRFGGVLRKALLSRVVISRHLLNGLLPWKIRRVLPQVMTDAAAIVESRKSLENSLQFLVTLTEELKSNSASGSLGLDLLADPGMMSHIIHGICQMVAYMSYPSDGDSSFKEATKLVSTACNSTFDLLASLLTVKASGSEGALRSTIYTATQYPSDSLFYKKLELLENAFWRFEAECLPFITSAFTNAFPEASELAQPLTSIGSPVMNRVIGTSAPKLQRRGGLFSFLCCGSQSQQSEQYISGRRGVEVMLKETVKIWKTSSANSEKHIGTAASTFLNRLLPANRRLNISEEIIGVNYELSRDLFSLVAPLIATTVVHNQTVEGLVQLVSSAISRLMKKKSHSIQTSISFIRNESELSAVVLYNVCLSFLAFHPLLESTGPDKLNPSVESSKISYAGLPGAWIRRLLHTNFKGKNDNPRSALDWIDQVSNLLITLLPYFNLAQGTACAELCCLLGVFSWLIFGCTWIILDISFMYASQVSASDLPPSFHKLMGSLTSSVGNFARNSNDLFKQDVLPVAFTFSILVVNVVYAFTGAFKDAASNSATKSWLPIAAGAAITILSRIVDISVASSRNSSSIAGIRKPKSTPAKIKREPHEKGNIMLLYASAALELLNSASSQMPKLFNSIEDQMLWMPDPYLSSLAFTNWKHTSLLNELHRSVVWTESHGENGADSGFKEIAATPLRVHVKQQSRFMSDGALVTVHFDIFNLTHITIHNLVVVLQTSFVKAYSDRSDYLINQTDEDERLTDEPQYIFEYKTPNLLNIGDLQADSRESCHFTLLVRDLVALEFTLQIKFNARLTDIEEEQFDEDDENELREVQSEDEDVEDEGDDENAAALLTKYSQVRQLFRSLAEHFVFEKDQDNMDYPTSPVGGSLSLFLRPYFGLGMWHNLYRDEFLLPANSEMNNELRLRNFWIDAGLTFTMSTYISSSAARAWNPSCLHLLASGVDLRIWVGEVLSQSDLLVVVMTFGGLTATQSSKGDISRGELNCLVTAYSSKNMTVQHFISALEFWMQG